MFFHRKKDKKKGKEAKQEETVIFEDEPMEVDDEAEEELEPTEPEEQETVLENEILEIEFDEKDIRYYLVDEDDNEVGFVLVDEEGNEVEYYYAEEEDDEAEEEVQPSKKSDGKMNTSLAYKAGAAAAGAAVAGKHAAKAGVEKAKSGVEKARGWADKFQPNDDGEYDLGITREGVKEATADMNTIYHEGVETIAELKEAFDDINESLHLDSFLGKKRRR